MCSSDLADNLSPDTACEQDILPRLHTVELILQFFSFLFHHTCADDIIDEQKADEQKTKGDAAPEYGMPINHASASS